MAAKQKELVPEYDLSWMDGADTVDQGSIDILDEGFPFFQWKHGNPEMKELGGVKYTGGWFIQADNIDEELANVTEWLKPGAFVYDNGGEEEGYFARDLTVAIIRYRRCWEIRYQNGEKWKRYAQTDFEKAAQFATLVDSRVNGRAQICVVVKELEDAGLFILTIHGIVRGRFLRSRQGDSVLNSFFRYVLRPAAKLNQKRNKNSKFDYRAFWLTVGPDRNGENVPLFTQVGEKGKTSLVTLPVALGLHDNMTPQELHNLYVGLDNLEEFNEQHEEVKDWAEAWDSFEEVDEEVEAEPTGDYAPEDVPF